jgi:hypothetical protein
MVPQVWRSTFGRRRLKRCSRELAKSPGGVVLFWPPVDKLSVAFVIVFAALLLGERLTSTKLFGGSLIVAGAIVLVL